MSEQEILDLSEEFARYRRTALAEVEAPGPAAVRRTVRGRGRRRLAASATTALALVGGSAVGYAAMSGPDHRPGPVEPTPSVSASPTPMPTSPTPSPTGTSASPANAVLAAITGVADEFLYAAAPVQSDAVAFPATMLMAAGTNQPHDNTAPTLTLQYCIALAGLFPVEP